MNKTAKWILVSTGALILLFFLFKVFGSTDNDAVKVTADVVKRCTIVETVNASGKIYPELEVKVGSGIAGEVTELYVKEGDSVKKGQVLAKIATESTRTPRLGMNEYSRLLQGIPPASSSTVSRISITAPISGIVSMLAVKKGERVGAMQLAGTEFIRIADFSSMELRVEVNENDIIKVKSGDSADVEVDAYQRRIFKGVVSSIANNTSRKDAASLLSNDAATYEVRIRLDKTSYNDLMDPASKKLPFRSGMNARADIKTQTKKDVLCVPAGAVASRAKGNDEGVPGKNKKNNDEDAADAETLTSDELEEVVFVIDADNKVSRRTVITGIQDMNHFEIKGGLREGEKVVTGPYSVVSRTLRNGSRVKAVTKEELFEK